MTKILIIGPSWVGDMVMSQSLYRLLKQQDSDVVIDVLAPAWSAPLLERMPEVRKAIALPFKHGEFNFKQRYQLGKSLRSEKYNQVIVLPNSWKSALIPFFAKIPRRTGWRGEMRYGLANDLRVLDKAKYPLMVERFLALGLPKQAALPSEKIYPRFSVLDDNVQAALNKVGLKADRPILALCPGAKYGPAKQWPAEYFAEVANTKLNDGWQVWVFGSAEDDAFAGKISQETGGHCVNLAGKTSLGEAIDLLSLSKAVVTNDSGLMHIASALDVNVIALYGSSSPEFTPPLSDKAEILWLHIECSPCFERVCPLGHFRCMKELKPSMVLEKLKNK